jgi:hypothetical protein
MYLNLAFVPIGHVEKKIRKCLELKVKENINQKFNSFKKYFEKTYIKNEENLCLSKEPLFSHCFWSVYDNVLMNIPRTTCSVEAWHRLLKCTSSLPHPNLAKFVEIIKNEEEITRVELLQETNGLFRFPRKNFIEGKLRLVVGSFKFFEGLGYFEALEKVVHWKFD